MVLINPWVVFLGIPALALILILLYFYKRKNPQKYSQGAKAANTQFVKNLPYYRTILRKCRLLSWALLVFCGISVCLALVLIARPAKTETVTITKGSRDIFLCMDVSTSLLDVNGKIVDRMKELVQGLEGDRFGIMIFNTAPVLLVPLTDDYDFILETLENLKKGFRSFWLKDGDYYYYVGDPANYYLQGGVVYNHEDRGSSLIGDGLAACVFSFPNPEEERTRVIILSTDNQLEGEPIITLPQAAALAKDKKITIYGIAPSTLGAIDASIKTEFQEAVKITGGALYIESHNTKISFIISEIDKKEKNIRLVHMDVKYVDKPSAAFFALTATLLLLFTLTRKVKL